MRQKTVIKNLLQSLTEAYCKVCQVLQSASGITKCDRLLLQSALGITKCDSYYKVRRNAMVKIRIKSYNLVKIKLFYMNNHLLEIKPCSLLALLLNLL